MIFILHWVFQGFVLNLEDLALGDGEAGDLSRMADYDEIEIHPLVSTHPRCNRPAIYVVDVLFLKPPVSLLPRDPQGVGILRELDDGEFSAVGDFNPVLFRVIPDERSAVAVADKWSSYRVERGSFHGYTLHRILVI